MGQDAWVAGHRFADFISRLWTTRCAFDAKSIFPRCRPCNPVKSISQPMPSPHIGHVWAVQRKQEDRKGKVPRTAGNGFCVFVLSNVGRGIHV